MLIRVDNAKDGNRDGMSCARSPIVAPHNGKRKGVWAMPRVHQRRNERRVCSFEFLRFHSNNIVPRVSFSLISYGTNRAVLIHFSTDSERNASESAQNSSSKITADARPAPILPQGYSEVERVVRLVRFLVRLSGKDLERRHPHARTRSRSFSSRFGSVLTMRIPTGLKQCRG